MDYVLLKQVHISFALISITGFILRWTWVMRDSKLASLRLTRTAPHVIDTLFLASAIMLAFTIGQFPFTTGWLTAKVLGLIAYILIGMVAMSRHLSRAIRSIAFVCALLVFAWILSVARLKTTWGFLGL